jgi:hypothetical protein
MSIIKIVLVLVPAQEKGWRGIVPLHSKRTDVEKKLGASVEQSPVLYKLKDMNILVAYASDGVCGSETASGWKVPRDTVITIAIHFKTRLPLSDLRIDSSKYKIVADPEMRGNLYYYNAEEGLGIQVNENLVESMSYFPATKDNHLLCPAPNAKQ